MKNKQTGFVITLLLRGSHGFNPFLQFFSTLRALSMNCPTSAFPYNMNDHTDKEESIHLYIKRDSSNRAEILILLEELR